MPLEIADLACDALDEVGSAEGSTRPPIPDMLSISTGPRVYGWSRTIVDVARTRGDVGDIGDVGRSGAVRPARWVLE
jgi:hypothetical protein